MKAKESKNPYLTNGHDFCSSLARNAHCYVVAATEYQWSKEGTLPYGCLDTYEGLLLCYNPQGSISWQQRYPSDKGANAE
jgi:hypothetical protein